MEPLPNRRGNEVDWAREVAIRLELQWSPFRIEGETERGARRACPLTALQWSPFRIEGET